MKVVKKKTNKITKDTSRKDLASISYKLESAYSVSKKDLLINKSKVLSRDKIEKKYFNSSLGQIDNQISVASAKLTKEIKKITLDMEDLRKRKVDVSEQDKIEILKALEKRRKKGTINNDLAELTIELSEKVKKIRKATKDAKTILKSSTLKNKKDDDALTLEEYKVMNTPKSNFKVFLNQRKSVIFYALVITYVIVSAILVLVVFLV